MSIDTKELKSFLKFTFPQVKKWQVRKRGSNRLNVKWHKVDDALSAEIKRTIDAFVNNPPQAEENAS